MWWGLCQEILHIVKNKKNDEKNPVFSVKRHWQMVTDKKMQFYFLQNILLFFL